MNNGWETAEFHSELFDEMVNEMWEKKRKERILSLKNQALHVIQVRNIKTYF